MLVGLYANARMTRVYVGAPTSGAAPHCSILSLDTSAASGRAHQLRMRAITRRVVLRSRPDARQTQAVLRRASSVPL